MRNTINSYVNNKHYEVIFTLSEALEKWDRERKETVNEVKLALENTSTSELFLLRSALAQELRRVVSELRFHDDITVLYKVTRSRGLGLIKQPIPIKIA